MLSLVQAANRILLCKEYYSLAVVCVGWGVHNLFYRDSNSNLAEGFLISSKGKEGTLLKSNTGGW